MMEIGADGSFLHIFAGYMVRGKWEDRYCKRMKNVHIGAR